MRRCAVRTDADDLTLDRYCKCSLARELSWWYCPVYLGYLAIGNSAALASLHMMFSSFGLIFALRVILVFVGAGVFGLFLYQSASSAGQEKVLGSNDLQRLCVGLGSRSDGTLSVLYHPPGCRPLAKSAAISNSINKASPRRDEFVSPGDEYYEQRQYPQILFPFLFGAGFLISGAVIPSTLSFRFFSSNSCYPNTHTASCNSRKIFWLPRRMGAFCPCRYI